MVLPTATWTAYNDFGGACHYYGIAGATEDKPSPILSMQRPWTRGLVWLPPGTPRYVNNPTPEMGDAPSYGVLDWAYAHGFAQFLGSAGYAQYDRHFLVWAEKEGYQLDIITQTDLHYRPNLLDAYPCVTIVGHDEYWTHEMRVAMEAYVEGGGHLARFGGNFLWQIRLEDEGRRQVCYKFDAIKDDPLRGAERAHLLTTAWESREVNWPGASTVGVNGAYGIYANWGSFAPLGQKGLTVYRPSHWAFAGTGLTYADFFGDKARILGYEVDGLDYTFHRGLPYPVKAEGVPESIEILGDGACRERRRAFGRRRLSLLSGRHRSRKNRRGPDRRPRRGGSRPFSLRFGDDGAHDAGQRRGVDGGNLRLGNGFDAT